MEIHLTVEQAALRLQMHPVSVRRLLARGQIRGVKRGRVWRVPESALNENPGQEPLVSPAVEFPSTSGDSPLQRALAMVDALDAKRPAPVVNPTEDAAVLLRAAREGHDTVSGEDGDVAAS